MEYVKKLLEIHVKNLDSEISTLKEKSNNNKTNIENCIEERNQCIGAFKYLNIMKSNSNEIEKLGERISKPFYFKDNPLVDSNKDDVIEDLKIHYDNRSRQGLLKYGTTLHENRDDDFLNHALEEAMDLTAYLKKLQMQTRFETLNKNILNWASEKGILEKGTIQAQHQKTLEEVDELCDALRDNNREEIIDAIGDIVVTLIIQCKMQGLNLVDCLDSAYNVISQRTGTMIEGQFVKDE